MQIVDRIKYLESKIDVYNRFGDGAMVSCLISEKHFLEKLLKA